jgi:Tol biopolymer transport system component
MRRTNFAMLSKFIASTLGFLLLMAPNVVRVEAAFPGFNGKIVFVRSELPTPCIDSCQFLPSQIYIMNPDGTGVSALTHDPSSNADPAWSPDGSRIAFSGGLSNDAGSGDIFLMQADGTGRVNLTNCPSADRSPAWSPDGTKIVFTQRQIPGGPPGVYVMNSVATGPACSGATLLVNNGLDPAWSPDGSAIAFVAVGETALSAGNIYLMNPDGTGVRQLTTDDPSFSDIQPSWSPDGSQLAFARVPNFSGPLVIDVINRDGSGLTALTTAHGFFSNNSEPAWSPDGKEIAFSRYTRTGPDIFVMNRNGNGDTQLTATSPISDDEQPNWQPLATRP